jgi:hypothetical protein
MLSRMAHNMVQRRDSRFAAEGRSCVCSNLRMAARAVTQLYDQILRQSGLRATQFSILAGVRGVGPILPGVIPFGMICGVFAGGVGLRPDKAVAMSAIVFPDVARRTKNVLLTLGIGMAALRVWQAFMV